MRLLIAVAPIMLLALSVNQQASAQSKEPDKAKIGQSETQVQPPATTPNKTAPSKEKSDSQENKTSKETKDWLYTIYLISGCIVCVFAGGTVVLVVRQIEALKAIERAWVIPEVRFDEGAHMASGTDGVSLYVRVKCSNQGKTPAWITSKQIGGAILQIVPENPNWNSMKNVEPLFETIASGEWKESAAMWVDAKGDGATGIATIFGKITYRDIFGKERIATFGYTVPRHGNLVRLDNPPAYNQNT